MSKFIDHLKPTIKKLIATTAKKWKASDSRNKADVDDWLGRFREICSDPLNILIDRVPTAGSVIDQNVILHNGNRVPVHGPFSYYGRFSEILVINRGVHEPLEEYIFQRLLAKLAGKPKMLELGAYWGHYSMWMKKDFPDASVWMVEPDELNLQAGINNFKVNGFEGNFVKSFVGRNSFKVDDFLKKSSIEHLDILHCDIQGFENEMLEDLIVSLSTFAIDYIFVSTHSQELHDHVWHVLHTSGYRIESSSNFSTETTSFDGLVFASSPKVRAIFSSLESMGRERILNSTAKERVSYLCQIPVDD